MKNNQKGFTLVELIVVVVIILILSGISVPAFMNYLEKSKETVDLGNMKNAYTELLAEAVMDNRDSPYFNNYYWTKVVPLTQTEANWQSGKNGVVTIAGYSSNSTDERNEAHWIGNPTKGGSCTIFVDKKGSAKFCFSYNFAPCLTKKINDPEINNYKGKTIIDLFQSGFTRVQSSGPTGYHLKEFVQSALGIDSDNFSFCVIPDNPKNPTIYEFYICTDYTMAKGNQCKAGQEMLVTGYRYNPAINKVIQTGTPQTLQTYVSTQAGTKFEGMIINGTENGAPHNCPTYNWDK